MPSTRVAADPVARWVVDSAVNARVVLDGGGADSVTFAIVDGRVRVGLVLLGRRPTDVTIHPGAGEAAIVDALVESGANPEPCLRMLQAELILWAADAGCWVPTQSARRPDLFSVIAAVAFPLVGQATELGVAAPREIPRWSIRLLAHRDPRDAADELVGGRPSRRLVSALAGSLVPVDPPEGATVALGPLALAVMGSSVLDQDRLANLFEASGPWQPPDSWPDVDTMSRAHRSLGRLGSDRAYRLLLEARGRSDGVRDLLSALRLYDEAHRLLGRAVPSRISALWEAALEVLPTVAGHCVAEPEVIPGPQGVAGQVRHGTRVTGPDHPPQPQRHLALRAPSVGAASVAPSTPISHAREVLALDGLDLGVARLRLPRTVWDLIRWGQMLHNCLGDFGPAAAAGVSVLIGVFVDERLSYCLELAGDGRLRQFHGPRNTAVPAPIERAVMRAIEAAGIAPTVPNRAGSVEPR